MIVPNLQKNIRGGFSPRVRLILKKEGASMRRRHFRVSLLVGKDEKVRDIALTLQTEVAAALSQSLTARNLKVTYIRQRPWWKVWR